jgi:hypothetical protein
MTRFDHFDDTANVRVLVACEFSGTVRNAFLERGFDAWSCDLLPSPDRSNRHIQGDATELLGDGWDLLMVAHPPCTRLCNSGVRWLTKAPPGRELADVWAELDEGARLFSTFWNAPIPRIAVENPVMHKHAKARIEGFRPAAQSVQPWMFGEPETKRTCLWLKGLPTLTPTYATWDACRDALSLPVDAKPEARVHKATPGPDRWAERSKFFPGIASAMADQWARAA